MKASIELRDKREARLRQQLKDTPMRPLPLFQLTGWTHFVDEEVEPPALPAGSSPAEARKTDEQAIAYHRHLRMVPTDAMTHMQHLANVLPYFDYLRDKLGISIVFCGTGASHRLHQARILAGELTRVSEENRVRLEQAGRPAEPVSPSPTALLPVTWLHPLPLDTEDDETFRRVLASFEADLSLYRLEENALSKHAVTLHQRTGGYFKALTYVISTAAVLAIRSVASSV
ncbi:hypothetical protein ME763_37745 (plasmid) [Streptomyces murinus]|uniref:hypothetical protein n=1 Tax=Streptomyces murinus TaxID=33900 RepID=UPI0015562625|nr:hypothetical protein [Streptomyces murinus]WDO11258.1 hypothetical protein ME763_37745 [Streptomyces murinus]